MKFKCKQSGNIYEFLQEHDIKTMLQHPEYEVVEEVKEQQEDKPKRKAKE